MKLIIFVNIMTYFGQTALNIAVAYCIDEILIVLIENGIDLKNKNDQTTLNEAAELKKNEHIYETVQTDLQ